METFLTREDWVAHIQQEAEQERLLREHTSQLRKMDLALFGDSEMPETLRNSISTTMIRMNAFIDVWKWVGGVLLGIAITSPFWLPLLKLLIQELLK